VANVISISGCKDNQTSADACINNTYQGAMTWSFLNALNNLQYNAKLTDLVSHMRSLLKTGYTQVPLLAVSSNDQYDRYFISNSITPTKSIKFIMTVDSWYYESNWNIWSNTDGKYVFPSDKVFTYKYQTMNISQNLAPGTYKLVVRDTYGDGGVTSLVTNGLITLVSGKMSFGKLAEYTFAI
jgi:hypothetical protein